MIKVVYNKFYFTIFLFLLSFYVRVSENFLTQKYPIITCAQCSLLSLLLCLWMAKPYKQCAHCICVVICILYLFISTLQVKTTPFIVSHNKWSVFTFFFSFFASVYHLCLSFCVFMFFYSQIQSDPLMRIRNAHYTLQKRKKKLTAVDVAYQLFGMRMESI